MGGDSPCYMMDFAAYKPPEELKVSAAAVERATEGNDQWPYAEDMKDFMAKVFVKSGLGLETTYLPPGVNPLVSKQPQTDVNMSNAEAEMAMQGCVTELLDRTGVKPSEIDILITNSSIFCPTPSMSSMLVNKFKLRPDIESYHLGGMGCAIGTIAVGLVRDMLKAHPNAICLLFSSEIITAGYYYGAERSRMVAQTIFRMGGSCALFTNKPSLKPSCKYVLEHCVRTHMGADDAAYKTLYWGPDKAGHNGMYLSKGLVSTASKAIEHVVRTITPKIMTWKQYGQAAVSIAAKKLGADVRDYKPDYTECLDHFLLHAGGYAVLMGIQEGMKLPNSSMIPSFAALREYGNTSASTTWYAFGYTESCVGVAKGQRVFQLGVGGGVKGGANVWRALKDIPAGSTNHTAWAHLVGKGLTEADLPRGIDGGFHSMDAANISAGVARSGRRFGVSRSSSKDLARAASKELARAASLKELSRTASKELARAASNKELARASSKGATMPTVLISANSGSLGKRKGEAVVEDDHHGTLAELGEGSGCAAK
ncbi:MAG: hypothetical protein WDW36_003669 [Sanguina aurantia]